MRCGSSWSSKGALNQSLQQTAAAMLILDSSQALGAAAAAEIVVSHHGKVLRVQVGNPRSPR
jgi:hypothetical protein